MTNTLELLGRAMILLKSARSIHEEGSEEACGFEYARQVFLDELAAMGVTVASQVHHTQGEYAIPPSQSETP